MKKIRLFSVLMLFLALSTVTGPIPPVLADGTIFYIYQPPMATGQELCALQTQIPYASCKALEALYNSTDGPH